MKVALIEAPRPNTCFAKYANQHLLPNILLDLAGEEREKGNEVVLVNHIANRESIVLPEADQYIVCISEVVEKCKLDKYLEAFLEQLKGVKNNLINPKQVLLVGWYAWLNKATLSKDFVILDPFKYTDVAHLTDPAWDLIDWDKEPLVLGKKRATLRTRRGCGNNCQMCPVPIVYGRDVVEFPINWIVKQIHTLYDLGVRQINFLDDNFLFNVKRAKLLLTILKEERNTTLKGMSYIFHEGMEVRQAQDEELVKLLVDANFKDIKLGVESLNVKTLDYIKKPYRDPELAINAIKNFNKQGVKPICLIVFGFPTDTEQDLVDMIEQFKKLKVKIRAQSLYKYPNMKCEDVSPVSKERLSELMNELLEATGSAIWRKR
jgi:radical SAM superfamily enzyme YgiQ (UPF0313 family)